MCSTKIHEDVIIYGERGKGRVRRKAPFGDEDVDMHRDVGRGRPHQLQVTWVPKRLDPTENCLVGCLNPNEEIMETRCDGYLVAVA